MYLRVSSVLGTETAQQFTNLLSMHTITMMRIIQEMENGNQEAVNQLTNEL